MPRLLGATVAVGVAALIIGTLFKLMLGLVIIGGIATLISHKVSKHREEWLAQYGQNTIHGFGGRDGLGNNPWANKMQPINNAQKATTIVPIN